MLGMRTDNLLQIDNPEVHDANYFAMLNNGVAVNETQYDGGNRAKALNYYAYLLKIKLPNCPIIFKLDPKLLAVIEKQIANMSAMQKLLDEIKENKTLLSASSIQSILSLIQSQSSETGVCYFPSGWSGTPGHFAVLKLRRLDNQEYAISVINHGAGIGNFHRHVARKRGKTKFVYQSDEYNINLNSEDGRIFIQHICELIFDLNREFDTDRAVTAYSENDLYPLLMLYGEIRPLKDQLNEKWVTPQRGGTCTITNTHAVARDILIDNHVDLATRKQYHFIIKLRSVIAGFTEYTNSRYPLPIMEWALKEFAVRINKEFHHTLSDADMAYCTQLHNLMQTQLEKNRESWVETHCKPVRMPSLTGALPPSSQIEKLLVPDQHWIMRAAPVQKKPDSTEAKYIVDVLTPGIFGKYSGLSFDNLYFYLNTLPHCTGLEKDPYWDKVPEKDILKIVYNIYALAQEIRFSDQDSQSHQQQSMLVTLRLYDIAAQLATRKAECKLTNKFAFALDDVYSYHVFNDAMVYQNIKHIVSHFEMRAKDKQRIISNTVNYADDQFDKSIHYIIREVLNEKQRHCVAQALMAENRQSSSKYSDEELFGYLMKNLHLTDKDTSILPPLLQSMIGISAVAHAEGKRTRNYSKNPETKVYSFHVSRFQRDLERKMTLRRSETYRSHMPASARQQISDFSDFSENTIYHPKEFLKRQRTENDLSSNDPYPQ